MSAELIEKIEIDINATATTGAYTIKTPIVGGATVKVRGYTKSSPSSSNNWFYHEFMQGVADSYTYNSIIVGYDGGRTLTATYRDGTSEPNGHLSIVQYMSEDAVTLDLDDLSINPVVAVRIPPFIHGTPVAVNMNLAGSYPTTVGLDTSDFDMDFTSISAGSSEYKDLQGVAIQFDGVDALRFIDISTEPPTATTIASIAYVPIGAMDESSDSNAYGFYEDKSKAWTGEDSSVPIRKAKGLMRYYEKSKYGSYHQIDANATAERIFKYPLVEGEKIEILGFGERFIADTLAREVVWPSSCVIGCIEPRLNGNVLEIYTSAHNTKSEAINTCNLTSFLGFTFIDK